MTITLPRVEGNIVVTLPDGGHGTIESELKDNCPYCGHPFCLYSCDQSQMEESDEERDGNGTPEERIAYNERIDGIEALILAAACAGVDIDSPEFQVAVQTAVEGASNNPCVWSLE